MTRTKELEKRDPLDVAKMFNAGQIGQEYQGVSIYDDLSLVHT